MTTPAAGAQHPDLREIALCASVRPAGDDQRPFFVGRQRHSGVEPVERALGQRDRVAALGRRGDAAQMAIIELV